MQTRELFVRCLAEHRNGVWQAFCLDFDLAVQGDSLREVKHKLHDQIVSYLYDALAGEDKAFAHQLLRRRSPWPMYAKWHSYRLLGRLHLATRRFRAFFEVSPMRPDCPKTA